ncbi:hypothetical protein V9T40_000623 [Parthenolecanium corni]|uniref:CHK kinase-like domain-containing protein n=1 Tax=Parthenolecanium corni TaxID=536013 RepID=A0AAN9TBH3_9HEMI
MNSFVETSLRNFCSTRDIFGDQSAVYVHFEKKPEGKEKQYGFNSGIIFGHIVYRTEQNEVKVSVPLMLKNMISKPYCQDYILVQYSNEIYFYTRALPLFQQLGDLQKHLPKFYDSYIHSSLSTTDVILIYEDLKAKGFRDHERFSFLDLEHLTLMVRALGQFHSYSYFAKSQNPLEFSALGKWFNYAEAELIRTRPNYFQLFARIGLNRLRADPRYSSHIAKVEKIIENADALVLQVNTMERKEPMSVLCHGDFLRGNVMFRYENSQLVDMKMIDMATCRIASPVVDLSLVLYLNADQQTRSQHWDHLIDAYYEGLHQVFGGIGVPSRESILKEFTTKALYGYLIASHFLPSLIEMDRGIISSFLDYLPSEFIGRPQSEIPESVFKDTIKRWCNEGGAEAEALADILRDMIDRRFI